MYVKCRILRRPSFSKSSMSLSTVSTQVTIATIPKQHLVGRIVGGIDGYGSVKIDTEWKKNDIFSFFIDRNAPDFGMIG